MYMKSLVLPVSQNLPILIISYSSATSKIFILLVLFFIEETVNIIFKNAKIKKRSV